MNIEVVTSVGYVTPERGRGYPNMNLVLKKKNPPCKGTKACPMWSGCCKYPVCE